MIGSQYHEDRTGRLIQWLRPDGTLSGMDPRTRQLRHIERVPHHHHHRSGHAKQRNQFPRAQHRSVESDKFG